MSNTKLNRRNLQVKRKESRMEKKKQVPCIFWKPKYTQLENEEPSTPVKGCAINQMGQLIWSVTIPFGYLRCLDVLLPIVGYLESNVLARGGESIVEVYIFSTLHWESLRYCSVWQIFMRYLCNCGLEFWYCGISKHAEVFVIGSGIFSMVVSNFSISLCSVTVFRIPLAALQCFFFFFAHSYTSAKRPAFIVW